MAFNDQTIRKLKAKLNGANVRTRDWQGRTLSYIEGWYALAEANRIFGFDGWSRETVELRCLSETKVVEGADCAYIAKVRISVKAGDDTVVREGTGAGYTQAASLAEAHALAAKEAETDATKRALSTFGNPFGLALYDRDRKGVRKSKAPQPSRTLWEIRDATGSVSARFTDTHACALALRQKLDRAETLIELDALWRGNQILVGELQQHLSKTDGAATNGTAAEYLDLASAHQRRYTKLWARQAVSPIDHEMIDKSRLGPGDP